MKDPLISRFVSGTCFAVAFVWVAIYFFDVDMDVIQVLFILCLFFVGGLILLGFLGVPLIRLMRKDPPLLSRIRDTKEINRQQGSK